MSESQIEQWSALARQLRVDSIRVSTVAGSGHPTSSLSAADLMAVLLTNHLRYDFSLPGNPQNDHLIFSKGHASPLLYSAFRAVGAIEESEFVTYRQLGSRLEGHPTPALPWVDVATGSLGQGLPIAVGIALSARRLENLDYRVWVLLGDSEMAEGSIWEAMAQASTDRLDNLVAIVDCNRLGQRGETDLGWDVAAYAQRGRAFGWRAVTIDGHDFSQIDSAYREALSVGGPTLIVARTLKGRGVSFLEDKSGWHGKALNDEEAERAITELGGRTDRIFPVRRPADPVATPNTRSRPVLPSYRVGTSAATRQVYGEALAALGVADRRIVALDAEVGNSTYSEIFQQAHPERFFQFYIREQLMVAAAVGLQVRGWIPFAATFGAFLSRAADFIRMAAVSAANVKLCGSHAGVSIGEDGPSQMALEDIAMMRAVTGSTVLYPCDANQTARLVAALASSSGIGYLRTTREKTAVLYDPETDFELGGSCVLRQSNKDIAAIVAAGITVHEALAAHTMLASEGIYVRVVDAYSVKPIDAAGLRAAAKEAAGTLIVVEDHRPEGGLGDAVLDAFVGTGVPVPAVVKLAVRTLPGSGTPAELRGWAGIDAPAIVRAVKALL